LIKYLDSFRPLYRASKSLKYGAYFITMFPFFAILIYNGFINSPYALFYILPFVPAFAVVFMYNTLGDKDKDPKNKNPITNGEVSEKSVKVAIVLLSLISIVFMVLIYSSKLSLLLLLVILFLAFVYSGFKLRLKESILGPVVASVGFFILPGVCLLSEFNYFSFGSVLLIVGLFIIYFAHEIKHTILEYDLDLSFNCRPFAVILGKKNANMMEYTSLIIGFIFLLASIYYLIPNSYMLPFYNFSNSYLILLFTIFFILSMITTVLYGFKTNFDQKMDTILNTLPYIATRTCYITIGLFLLKLPVLIILFVVWILFTDKYL
jgi:4-hydroxybenzoate polyprenyltransferase